MEAKKPLILIVDDEDSILELIRFHLDKNGYSTLTAASGRNKITFPPSCSPPVTPELSMSTSGVSGQSWER